MVQPNEGRISQREGQDKLGELCLLPEDRLLLKAALLVGPASIKAWHQWRELIPVDEIAESSGWLLPLLYRNLSRQGIPNVELARYEYVYRHNWYKNQLFYRNIGDLFFPLVEKEQAHVWLKGVALATLAYADFGARPINHVDLWLNSEEREDVEDHLVTAGWNQQTETPATTVEGMARYGDDLSQTICLYTQLVDPALDDEMRQRAKPFRIRQMPTLTLAPVDHLTFLFATFPKWDTRSTLLWVADAATLIASLSPKDHILLETQLTRLPDAIGVQARARSALTLVMDLIGNDTENSQESFTDESAR